MQPVAPPPATLRYFNREIVTLRTSSFGVPPAGRAVQGAQRIREALATGASEITLGPLGAYRDFVDVQDVAALLRTIVLAPEVPSRIYNAGSGRAVTVREAVGMLAAQRPQAGPAQSLLDLEPVLPIRVDVLVAG